MKMKKLGLILTLVFVPLFVSAAPAIESLGFEGTQMVFNASDACQSELTYTSADKTITYSINDPVYRQDRKVQLWNLDFTSFDYVLKLNDNQGNVTEKQGTFTVVPADPTLIRNSEDTLEALRNMTREQLIEIINNLLK